LELNPKPREKSSRRHKGKLNTNYTGGNKLKYLQRSPVSESNVEKRGKEASLKRDKWFEVMSPWKYSNKLRWAWRLPTKAGVCTRQGVWGGVC
jgi:hypothetical protein